MEAKTIKRAHAVLNKHDSVQRMRRQLNEEAMRATDAQSALSRAEDR